MRGGAGVNVTHRRPPATGSKAASRRSQVHDLQFAQTRLRPPCTNTHRRHPITTDTPDDDDALADALPAFLREVWLSVVKTAPTRRTGPGAHWTTPA